jgi:hypothetical protein
MSQLDAIRGFEELGNDDVPIVGGKKAPLVRASMRGKCETSNR